MTDPILPPVLAAVFKAAVPKVIQQYQKLQAEKARDAIEKQLARGRYWAITDDKAAAAIWRYLRAAMEGAARRNLELLAEALVSGAIDPEFAPDEFKRQADRLEGVNRKEIIVLAAFIRANALQPRDDEAAIVSRHELVIASALKSGLFTSEADIVVCMSSLTRTGWICPVNAFGFSGYRLTSELLRLSALVDFDAAVEREFDGSDLT